VSDPIRLFVKFTAKWAYAAVAAKNLNEPDVIKHLPPQFNLFWEQPQPKQILVYITEKNVLEHRSHELQQDWRKLCKKQVYGIGSGLGLVT
jgi:hypothetical protein